MDYNNYFENQTQHRKFRLSMAAAAIKSQKYIRTLKFPLEIPSKKLMFNFDDAKALFNTTEGIAKGSLAGFLLCLLNSGFRVFSKSDCTKLFRSQSALPMTEFEACFQSSFARAGNDFSPSGLITYFSAEKRTFNKDKIPLTQTMLASALYKLATKTTPEQQQLKGKEKEIAADFYKVCSLTANIICDTIKEWRDLCLHVDDALKAVDTALATLGYNFPQVSSCSGGLATLQPENSTIDFDHNALIVENLDTEHHELMAYQAIATISHYLRSSGKDVTKANLQNAITTQTNNALSWLFGPGLKLWKETDIQQLSEWYRIPAEKQYLIQRIKDYALAIKFDELYGESSYAKYRSTVGGKLDSWITNYSKRLLELEVILNEVNAEDLKLSAELLNDTSSKYFSGSSLSAQELQQLMNLVTNGKIEAQKSLTSLLGKQNSLPIKNNIDQFEQFSALINDIVGEVASLNNRLDQEIERSNNNNDKEKIKALKFTSPKWLKELPKVPSLSGGVPNYEQDIIAVFKHYPILLKQYFAQIDTLINHANWHDVVNLVKENELHRLANHKDANTFDYAELAQRRLLDNYLHQLQKAPLALKEVVIKRMLDDNLAQTVDDENVQQKDKAIFQRKKQSSSLNKLILNQQGRVYVNPYSRNRHQPWGLNCNNLNKIDLFNWIEQDIKWFDVNLSKKIGDYYRLKLDWQIMQTRFKLHLLPKQISTSSINQQALASFKVPAVLQAQLKLPEISKDQVSKILNLYTSELRAIQSVIFRESFFLRTRFTRIGDNKICYTPKYDSENRWAWKIPEQLLRSEKPVVKLIQQYLNDQNIVEIDSLKSLAKQQGKLWQRSSCDTGALLKEMPHDWCLNLGFAKQYNITDQEAFLLDKEKLSKPLNAKQLCRLQGNTTFKGWLDKQLTDSLVTIGDYTLIIEQHYKQTITQDNDGNLVPEITTDSSKYSNGLKLEVALPISQEPCTEKIDFSQTYIGIDLGEAGIGYAVVCSKNHEIIDKGEIAIRSVRNLIRAVKYHRKQKQPKQKFTQRFDTSLMKLRENVVGDISHVIDSLMAHYKGVPILESTVGNLASGAKQLQLVYDKVLHLYLYSSTDAHKAARSHFWCGSENWEHPFAKETIQEFTKTKKAAPKEIERNLKLFPGSGVHPAGTSQVCSECYRNPYEYLDEGFANVNRITTDSDGLLDLGDTKLKFVSTKMDDKTREALPESERNKIKKERKQRDRDKERIEMKYPIIEKPYTLDEAKKQLRRQLRRAPTSLRSKDTSQSRYFCAFSDCGHSMHADANAAINIVFKWIKNKKITKF